MSLKPGIGADWFRRFKSEVFCRDGVVVRGRVGKTPRYYDNMTKAMDGFLFDELKFARLQKALACLDDSTPERLATREVVTKARLQFKKRTL